MDTPNDVHNDSKVEETVTKPRSQALRELFEGEKQKLVGKYRRKREELSARGVFDSNINAIRAENMLLTALGKIKMSVLAQSAASKDPTGFETGKQQKPDTEEPTVNINTSSIASKLEAELNKSYRDSLHGTKAKEEERKKKNRSAQLKKGISAIKRQGNPVHSPGRNDLSPGNDTDGLPSIPTVQSFRADDNLEISSKSKSLGSPAGSLRCKIEKVTSMRIRDNVVTPSPSPSPSPSPREQQSEASGVQFTAAGWLQKQWEHLSYPCVENRLKKRAKKLDNATRPTDTVHRYTQPRTWMTGAAVQHETAGKASWERNAAILNVESMLYSPSLLEVVNKDVVMSGAGDEELPLGNPTLPQPKHVLYNPGFKGKEHLRDRYKAKNKEVLMEQKTVVHGNMRVQELTNNDIFHEDSGDSDVSSEGDRLAELPSENVHSQQETLDLLEGVVTFMCKEYSQRKIGRGNRMSDVRVMRNLLIQSLRSLLGALDETTDCDVLPETKEEDNNHQPVPNVNALIEHRVALLRTWSKGVEVLLTWDLDLSEPYTPFKERHQAEFAKYYAGLRCKINKRVYRLMDRWKARSIKTGPAEDVPIEKRLGKRDMIQKKRELAATLGKVAIDGSDPTKAQLVRSFMERFGFVPCGSSCGDDVLGTVSSNTERVRSILLSKTDGTSKEPVPPQHVPGTNIYYGSVLATPSVYIVTVDEAHLHLQKTTSSVVDPKTGGAQVKSPLPRGTLVVVIKDEQPWMQLENGYWVSSDDVLKTESTAGEVMQHSADNATMRQLVGSKEARARQKAQLLNDLLAVLHKYLKMASRHIQEDFVKQIKAEMKKPRVPQDDAKLQRLFDYDTDDSESDGGEKKVDDVDKQSEHQVIKDALLKKYSVKQPTAARRRQKEVSDSDMWSKELNEMRGGAQKVAQLSKKHDPELPMPSLSSSESSSGSGDDDVLVSKFLSELDNILSSLKMGFTERHKLTTKYTNMGSVSGLRLRYKLWKKACHILQAWDRTFSNLLRNINADRSFLDTPNYITSSIRVLTSLSTKLMTAAQRIHDTTGDTFTFEGLAMDGKLQKDYTTLQAAIETGRDTPLYSQVKNLVLSDPLASKTIENPMHEKH